MEAQRPDNVSYGVPPPFSPTSSHRSSADLPKPLAMDLDMTRSDQDRSVRAASVLSGMSVEDMEAAETLNSLQQSLTNPSARTPTKRDSSQYSPTSQHPSQQLPPPLHVHTTTTFDKSQPEPLLRLFTSQYPLAGSLVNGSLSAYKMTQSYIPGAEWTERNVGLPIAGKVARISGAEAGLRWYLKPRQDGKSANPSTPDVEKGQEVLPAYNPGDRSPPYSEQEVLLLQQSQSSHPPPNWRQQLIISTSGLGVAMSQESFRSLRFCLGWLRWANGRLGEAIQNLKVLLERYGDSTTVGGGTSPLSPDSMSDHHHHDQRQAQVAARVAALRQDVINTLKQVVGIVSQYAGGALPENARNLVQRHLTSLPQRFSIANAANQSNGGRQGGEGSGNEMAASASRAIVLAQEGLDMMTQVSRVVNDTLVSAEGWFERLGRGQQQQDGGMVVLGEKDAAEGDESRSATVSGDNQGDVKMGDVI
ncbi:Clock-controlled protein 8 [Cyphellophora attinorum]|uniref:Clock-controlled protein 8 n=1 Tax=Cyphellophora attinorum TaxID=1664694 RepID=A0A0N1GY13_9EURO|nr:Clock-controlled protein 8 [Phialophora attinorum]KPI35450.1 Clock-controlled protein 8 [Phialophora attinorum]